jgi:hypothetical protein
MSLKINRRLQVTLAVGSRAVVRDRAPHPEKPIKCKCEGCRENEKYAALLPMVKPKWILGLKER